MKFEDIGLGVSEDVIQRCGRTDKGTDNRRSDHNSASRAFGLGELKNPRLICNYLRYPKTYLSCGPCTQPGSSLKIRTLVERKTVNTPTASATSVWSVD